MKRYINFKSDNGLETVDELNSKDFKSLKLFFKELRRLLFEYRLAGMNVYASQKACKNWK